MERILFYIFCMFHVFELERLVRTYNPIQAQVSETLCFITE